MLESNKEEEGGLLLETRVRTPRGGLKQHGAPVLHPCHPHEPELAKIGAAQTRPTRVRFSSHSVETVT